MQCSPFDPDCSVSPVRARDSAAKTTMGASLIIALLLGAVGGCTSNESQSGPAPATKAAPPIETKTDTTSVRPQTARKIAMDEKNKHLKDKPSGTVKHSIPPELMQRLIDSVASDAGVNADEVVLDRAEDVTWRDGSLGCPQPNMAYSQALVEGYWVVLRAGGEEFDMRVVPRGTFMRCQGSTRQAPIRYKDDEQS